MKVAFYGGQTAGVITLLTLLAEKVDVRFVIAEDEKLQLIAQIFNLELKPKALLGNENYIEVLKNDIDFFICSHGKKILSENLVNKLRCINLHPCLYKYKGARPIKRLIADNNPKASVASHWMTEKIDEGETIVEEFIQIDNVSEKTEADVYNNIYPLYSQVIIKTIEKISKQK